MAKSIPGVLVLLLIAQALAASPDGARCTQDLNCNNRCYKGSCTSEVGYGGTCDYKWECIGALVCRERKCVQKGGAKSRSNLKPDGARCMSNKECKNTCINDRCQSRPRAGGFCNRSDQCYGKLICRNGKCQMKKGHGKVNGKKCKNNYECVNICFAGYCRNARRFGQSCFRNIQCKEELVCVERACRSGSYTPKRAEAVAIPRPAKKKAPAPTRTRKPKTRAAQPKRAPVAAPAPAPAQAPKTGEGKGIVTKEGKTAGAQAAIQKSKEEKEKPATTGILRSGPGAEKRPETRSKIMKFFFCLVHQDEC